MPVTPSTPPQAPGSSRDLLLLDIALESWLRLLVERQDKRSLSGDDLVELMGLVLGNAALTVRVLTVLQQRHA